MVSTPPYAGDVVFLLFFIGLGVAYLLSDYTVVRGGFLTGFVTIFVVFSLIGFSALPIVSFHKFSKPYPNSQTYYTMEVVTESGEAMFVDDRALRPMIPYNIRDLAERMATEYADRKAHRVGCFVLRETNEYRTERVRSQGLLEYVDFPPHDVVREWSKQDLERVSTFTAVRVDEIELTSSEDGAEILDRSEAVAFSFDASEGNRCGH